MTIGTALSIFVLSTGFAACASIWSFQRGKEIGFTHGKSVGRSQAGIR